MDNVDTDTLLAILASLVDPCPEPGILLDALIAANGDVESAARALRSSHHDTNISKKRAAPQRIDEWVSSSTSTFKEGRKKTKTVPITRHKTGVSREADEAGPGKVNKKDLVASDASTSKNLVSLNDVLRAPIDELPQVTRRSPLTLATPALVEKHTPCTLHLSVLPPELASRLFYVMADAAKDWKPNKWWLFDRVVESPHKTCFYARKMNGLDDNEAWQEAAQYWYNGRATSPPSVFSPEMEEACRIVEDVVNKSLQHRSRYPLEWGGSPPGGASLEGKCGRQQLLCWGERRSGISFRSVNLSWTFPYNSVSEPRIFRLREVIPKEEIGKRQAQTFNIPLSHNSLVIMHASTQERFKHSVPPQRAVDLFRSPFPPPFEVDRDVSNCRINITFRFYRPDFRPDTTPKCHCDVPCVLRADMKGRTANEMRYFWMCYAGAQNDGKGCSFLKVMDCISEGRGPFACSVKHTSS